MANNTQILKSEINKRFLRLPEVIITTGISKAQIYLLISKNEFPKQIKIGDRASAWLQSEIINWMDKKISDSC